MKIVGIKPWVDLKRWQLSICPVSWWWELQALQGVQEVQEHQFLPCKKCCRDLPSHVLSSFEAMVVFLKLQTRNTWLPHQTFLLLDSFLWISNFKKSNLKNTIDSSRSSVAKVLMWAVPGPEPRPEALWLPARRKNCWERLWNPR